MVDLFFVLFDLLQNPAEKISGTFCECRNFGCDLHNGKECGGMSLCLVAFLSKGGGGGGRTDSCLYRNGYEPLAVDLEILVQLFNAYMVKLSNH